MNKNTPRGLRSDTLPMRDRGAKDSATPGSFGGLENGEEVIAKPSIYIMTRERYEELSRDLTLELTPEEVAEGYHFCMSEWDGLLVHKDDPEAKFCTCE